MGEPALLSMFPWGRCLVLYHFAFREWSESDRAIPPLIIVLMTKGVNMGALHESVIFGAEFLDEWMPGWHNDINLKNLAIQECRMCILGQLFGDFVSGCSEVGIDYNNADVFGFEIPSASGDGSHAGARADTEYAILNHHWRKQIEKRILNDGVEL